MANYPSTLPSATPATHGVVNDEIVAIATELGIAPRGAAATVRARLDAADGGTVVTPEQYGAVGDGVTNDQTALQNWLNALGAGKVGKLAENKVYAHNNVLRVLVASTLIRATRTSELLATDPLLASLRVEANGAVIEDLRLRSTATVRGSNGQECSSLSTVAGVTDLTVRRCVGVKAAGTGFFIFGVTRALIEDCVTYDSLADSLHMTYGTSDVIVRRHRSLYGGDDGIAVVSYVGDPNPVRRVRVESPTVLGQKGSGRGIAVVGGTDIMLTDVRVFRSYGAGIYLGTESNGVYTTYPTTNVVVAGAELVNCNFGTVDHGAILVLSEDVTKPVGPVTVTDVSVRDTRRSASNEIRVLSNTSGTFTGGVTLDRIHISGDGPDAILGGGGLGMSGVTIGTITTARLPLLRHMTADVTVTSTTGAAFFTWGATEAGTYLMEIEGIYQISAVAAVQFTVTGNVVSLGANVRTTIDQATSNTASYRAPGFWVDYQGAAPAATATQYPFRFQAYVDILTFPTAGGNLQAMVRSASGTVTFKAGTWGRLTKVRP